MANFCDRDAFVAIIDALKTTGEFAEVMFGISADRSTVGADRVPLAVIAPTEWTERDTPDTGSLMRRVGFSMTLVVRHEDPTARFERLDQLVSLARDAIDGSDLGGGCPRALTKIRGGRHDPGSRHPEQRIVLIGEFSYLIPAATGPGASAGT